MSAWLGNFGQAILRWTKAVLPLYVALLGLIANVAFWWDKV